MNRHVLIEVMLARCILESKIDELWEDTHGT